MKHEKYLCVLALAIALCASGCSLNSDRNLPEENTVNTPTETPISTITPTTSETHNQTETPSATEDPYAPTPVTTPIVVAPTESFDDNESSNTDSADMHGDYIGDLVCSSPPHSSIYTVYNHDDYTDCIALYVDNIDNGNFYFHLTRCRLDTETHESSEELYFKEHIAHYNGSGFYEYIGKEYHLYFRYTEGSGMSAAENTVEVFGLNSLVDPYQYGDLTSDLGMTGSIFRMNVPFAG